MTNPATLDKDILASLRDTENGDAHRLYDAAISFVARVELYSPAVLRATADALAAEVQRGQGKPNEQAMLLAMIAFLAHETNDR
jgi:hypothetical protein